MKGIGKHRDNEADLDPDAPIASLSFGGERPFHLWPDAGGKGSPSVVMLPHGTLLLFGHNDYHELRPRAGACFRINITLRRNRVA